MRHATYDMQHATCIHHNADKAATPLIWSAADFGTRKALLVDGTSGELIGLAQVKESAYASFREQSRAAAATGCTVVSVDESACSCDGFAHMTYDM